MPDIYGGPFITQISSTILTDLTASSAGATQGGKIRTALAALKTLVCVQTKGTPMYHPDFAKISKATADKIAKEIDAISAAITP